MGGEKKDLQILKIIFYAKPPFSHINSYMKYNFKLLMLQVTK